MGDYIELTGMEFYGYHGCLEEEREKGQSFFVDLVMRLDLSEAGRTDDLEKTVNYASVFACVREIVEGEPRRLIEAVAESVAEQLLRDFPLLSGLRVTVHKPSAPIAGKFRDVAVSIERARA